jgi:hypothetical protein
MERSFSRLDADLDSLSGLELQAPAHVRREFNRKVALSWVYHELHVEGTPISGPDVLRAASGDLGRNYCDGLVLQRARTFLAAYDRMRDASLAREPLSLSMALEYHALLLGGPERAVFRTESGATEQYKQDVIAPERIESALEELVREVRHMALRAHPIALAALVHHRFTRIWPFDRHSAAVARLLANQVLLSHGYPAIIIPAYDRQRYYHVMNYELARTLELFTSGVNEQIQLRRRELQPRPESVAA